MEILAPLDVLPALASPWPPAPGPQPLASPARGPITPSGGRDGCLVLCTKIAPNNDQGFIRGLTQAKGLSPW